MTTPKNTRKNAKIITDYEGLKKVPMIKLEEVFPPSELNALIAKGQNKKPVRQYLYRARKRYDHFEELFGVKLEL